MQAKPIPRLPVFGWRALRGSSGTVPCMLDAKHLVYTTSGRAAILLGLEALGVQAGDTVLVPSYHCPTMIAPVAHLGARPHFYPIDQNGVPDLGWLEHHVTERTRVLLVPHYFGWPQPMASIRAWCNKHRVALLEDGAHALFGLADQRPIGSWGDVAIGSLTKFLPSSDGGCLVLNGHQPVPTLAPQRLLAQVKAVADVADVAAQQGFILGLNTVVKVALSAKRQGRVSHASPCTALPLAHPEVDGVPPYRQASGSELLIDAEAAHRAPTAATVALANTLPRNRNAANRRAVFLDLLHALSDTPGMRPLKTHLPEACVPYVFPLWVDHPDPGFAALRTLGMPVFRWDRLWPGMARVAGDQGLLWSHHVVQLACHQDLGAQDVQRFVQALKQQWAAPETVV
jgi:perosamine synthetase